MRALLLFSAATLAAATYTPKKPEPPKPLTSAQKAEYAKLIQPMFDAHCVSCHGPKKEKGKLRLDTLEATLKGGKNPTFVIGKPNSSMLLSRVFLDRTAGDVMPPKAEKPMTEKQKEALRYLQALHTNNLAGVGLLELLQAIDLAPAEARLMRDLEAEALSAYKTLGRFLGKLDGLVTTTRVSTGSQSYYLRYGLSAAGAEWLAREFEL